jgi:hypothetical protein
MKLIGRSASVGADHHSLGMCFLMKWLVVDRKNLYMQGATTPAGSMNHARRQMKIPYF